MPSLLKQYGGLAGIPGFFGNPKANLGLGNAQADIPPTRQFTPGPMADVPFMPAAQVGPQSIALSQPPAPAAPPGRPPVAPGPVGGGSPWATVGPSQPPTRGGSPWATVGPFGQGYQTPMELQVAQQAAAKPAQPFDPSRMQLGAILAQGGSIHQMLPFLSQMMKGRR